MKRSVLVVLSVLAVAAGAQAQTPAETIERALAAAPRNLREGAAVIKWNPDHTWQTLKEGTNRLVCYDRSGEKGRQPFAVQCTSVGNLPRVAQSRKFEMEASTPDELRAKIAAAEKDGTRVKPEFGSLFVSVNGADQASARMHTTIAVPGATTATLGLPDNPKMGGAWIMDAGTSTAHIMTPGH